MRIVVEDANVLLDLVHGGILGIWLGAGFQNCTTHLVWNEVTNTAQRDQIQPFIDAGLIELLECGKESWEEIRAFAVTSGVSIPDSSVWWIAKRDQAILLTGDSKLRSSAKQTDVEVRGVLWVLDELLERERITKLQAAEALKAMIAGGAFLPAADCQNRLARWSR